MNIENLWDIENPAGLSMAYYFDTGAMMENITEEERRILYECIELGKTDGFFRYFSDRISNTIRTIYKRKNIPFTKEDTEDYRNDVFLNIFEKECEKLRQYNEELGSFKGWIKLITNSTVLNKIRKKGFDSLSEKRNQISIDEAQENGLLKPKSIHVSIEDSLMLKDTIEKLPPGRERLVLQLYHRGLAISEIAAYLHETEDNIHTIKSRAIKRLKSIISKEK